MSNKPHSNNEHTIIQIPNAEIASKSATCHNTMLMVKAMLYFMIIIGTLLVIDNKSTKPNQRHLNSAVTNPTLVLFGRMEDGELRAFEVSPSASVHDVYQEIEATVGCIVGTLAFDGKILKNEEETFVADAGISAECVIDVILANDLQILDRAIKNPNVYLWPSLINKLYLDIPVPRMTCGIMRALLQVKSYEMFEAVAVSLNMSVMELGSKVFDHGLIQLSEGNIIALSARDFWGRDGTNEDEHATVNLDILSQLTELSILYMCNFAPEIDLSALGAMKNLEIFSFQFFERQGLPEERIVVIPDMSECTKLEKLEFSNHATGRVVIDCRQSKLESVKEKVIVDEYTARNIPILWPQ